MRDTPRTAAKYAEIETALEYPKADLTVAAAMWRNFASQLERELRTRSGQLTTSLNMHHRHAHDAAEALANSKGHVCEARVALDGIKNRSDQVMKVLQPKWK